VARKSSSDLFDKKNKSFSTFFHLKTLENTQHTLKNPLLVLKEHLIDQKMKTLTQIKNS
jgi:hypothetical protein